MTTFACNSDFIQRLQEKLNGDLPGFVGQQGMMPSGRKVILPEATDFGDLKPAAVLIALFQEASEWHFPLIKRVEDGFAHSGQIALPGGRLENDETAEAAALREAEEEIGLDQTSVTVIGKLSPLPIPISGYLVHPIVGTLATKPTWRMQPGEVDEVFTASIQELLDASNRTTEVRQFRQQSFTIPYFRFDTYKVWGATAMILAEFEHILQNISSAPNRSIS